MPAGGTGVLTVALPPAKQGEVMLSLPACLRNIPHLPPSTMSPQASEDRISGNPDHYIPTPNADGTCTPHIHDAGENQYWVVCRDCSTHLVEGEVEARDKLEECDNGASG